MSQEAFDALCAIVGTDAVLGGADAAPYLTEWRGAFTPRALAVVLPASTDEVAALVVACADYNMTIVAQSGNTGLVGGSAADDDQAQIILNLARMNRVRELDASDNAMTVEAGCILNDVKAAAAEAGRYFPLSLASGDQCRIGGNLATNAGGLNVLRYGNTRDLTFGLEVVLADGRIWSDLSPLRKDNSGFDLRDLFIGSEGVLGVITAATLKLSYPERQRATALCAVATPADALAITQTLIDRSGGNVVACELMSRQAVQLVQECVADDNRGLSLDRDWFVLVELASSAAGDWLTPILEDVLVAAHQEQNIVDYCIAGDENRREAQWQLRESIPKAQRVAGASIKHDISLPVGRMPVFLECVLPEIKQLIPGVRPCPFGHLGDGNIHFNLTRPIDADNDDFLARTGDAHRLVHDRVVAMGGSLAAEHGIGRLKIEALECYKAAVENDLTRRIKSGLDPSNHLNPGVMLGAEPPRGRQGR